MAPRNKRILKDIKQQNEDEIKMTKKVSNDVPGGLKQEDPGQSTKMIVAM